MKRVLSVILCAVLLCSAAITAYADLPHMIDEAALLTADEVVLLEKKAHSVSDTYGMDVVILTVQSLEGKSSQDYADDFYDDNGYGIGTENSGVLLLIAMESREWYISTCGNAIYALTDYGIDMLADSILAELGSGEYYSAFDHYLDLLADYFEAYQNGAPIDRNTGYNDPVMDSPYREDEHIVYYPGNDTYSGFNKADIPYGRILLISLVIGVAAAGISLFAMRSTMNSAKPQRDAGSYVKNGSYRLNQQRDIFLYSHVSKVRRSEDSGGSRGGHGHSGGSSVHRSSGGSHHGGHGGRF